MSGSPFGPPDGTSPELSPPGDLGGLPPITIREPGQPANVYAERRPRFQFSLRSLLLVTTGVCVLVSLVAWLGIIFFMAITMLAGVVTVFVGTFRLDNRVILAGGVMMFVSSVLSPFMFLFAQF